MRIHLPHDPFSSFHCSHHHSFLQCCGSPRVEEIVRRSDSRFLQQTRFTVSRRIAKGRNWREFMVKLRYLPGATRPRRLILTYENPTPPKTGGTRHPPGKRAARMVSV